ncbi:uncharacterized protein LOC143289919 isoform X1 [Babylonia areolata]|uniref:uncharacterized protein LOC143289919 isoform X1 n=1 Tax=Babylonia areolata TaxID=304850 RepID=UPI003FD2E95E
MEWTALSCVVFAIFLSIKAEPVVSSPPEDRSLSPDTSALYDERVKKMFSDLKELFQEGDSHLKERIEEGLEHVKEQRKDGDERLKEELDEDVDWLKERQDKRQRQTEDELAEGEEKTNRELTELKEAFGKLQDNVKQWTQPNSVMTEDLKQQTSILQAELNSTKKQMSVLQSELNSNNQQTSVLQAQLNSNKQQTSVLQAELNSNKQLLQTNKAELQSTLSDLHSLQEKVKSLEQELQSAQEIRSLDANDGSTFVRWGRTTCPDNTSLVYSGVAGGSWYSHTGGSSDYLCLVMDPQMDNTTVPSHYSYLSGVEYDNVKGHHDQDAVCSVCRAPQSTTLMIPATHTCPAGWTSQYRGHLMTEDKNRDGRTEYTCVDEVRENRPGGHENKNGALFYHVVTKCGSLPCPPYVPDKVVTCVVCSK